jgi:sodium/hydrogen exchanger-like protein 6/7
MVSELFELSGIISLLTSGVLMAHYAWYNLSPQSKTTTSLAFGAIGFGAEAFVFAYLGLTFFSYASYEWSWQFFISEFFVIVIGRFLGIIGLLYGVSILFGQERAFIQRSNVPLLWRYDQRSYCIRPGSQIR